MSDTFNPQKDLVAVIMAGGSGTRFWPLSLPSKPKQFLTLFGDRTMLQLTVDRLSGMVPPERTLVLTNGRHAGLVRQQLPQIPAANVIGSDNGLTHCQRLQACTGDPLHVERRVDDNIGLTDFSLDEVRRSQIPNDSGFVPIMNLSFRNGEFILVKRASKLKLDLRKR